MQFDALQAETTNPASTFRLAVPVTPADGADLSPIPDALYIGTAGNLVFDNADGLAIAATPVIAGLFPIKVKRVRATLTTATFILALYY